MRERADGSLETHSAYEARVVGAVATLAMSDGSRMYILRDEQGDTPPSDEISFIDRKAGMFPVAEHIASLFKNNLHAIIERGQPYENVTPEIAQEFLDVIASSKRPDLTEVTVSNVASQTAVDAHCSSKAA